MQKILLIEDAPEVPFLLKSLLAGSAEVHWASTLSDGRSRLKRESFDLILLDVSLPDGDGFEFFQNAREAGGTLPPVIFLTARSAVGAMVHGLNLGAEDYIPKCLDMLEIKARIQARLRKQRGLRPATKVERVGALEINHESLEAFHCPDTSSRSPLQLTKSEFKILCLMMEKQNQLTSREDLVDWVWGQNFHVYPRSVDTHISNLRKKLPTGYSIQNVHAQGYRLVVDRPGTPSLSGDFVKRSGALPGSLQ